MALTYEQLRSAISNEPLPCMVVDEEALSRNVAHSLSQCPKGRTIRIATKSVRVPEILRSVLARSPQFQGLLCYSAQEAYELSNLGFDDLFVAYPAIHTADLEALKNIHQSGKKIRIVVDSALQVQKLAAHMRGISKPFEVALDIDMSLRLMGWFFVGVRRSSLRSVEKALNLYREIARTDCLKCAGLMGYEAQVAGLQDRSPFGKILNPIKQWIRNYSQKHAIALRTKVVLALRMEGCALELVNGGGSGNLNWLSGDNSITEVTVGSGFFASHLFDNYSNISFEPACFYALQAVRSSDPGYVTCLGGGYVASGEIGKDRLPVPYLPKGCELVSMEGAGEVQTPVKVPPGVEVGSPVFFRHAKAGEVMERFNEVLLLKNGQITQRHKTYRGMGWSFF